ncbi:MAG: helix-turn-helix domain-containing protein [Ignavibacteria bacterium]|nr:helix-turn-helix domain-containing protein [Ignavibacteria bacterium]
MLDKFAEKLRQAREENEITLQQMAAKTRIDIKFLEAIDNGNFSFLPTIYVRAFIKQYAKTVGLDEEETIKKYEAAKQGKLPEKVKVEEKKETVDEKIHEPEKKQAQPLQTFTDITETQTEADSGKKKGAMMMGGAVAGVVVIAILIYLVFFQNSSQIIVEEKPYEEVLEESTQRYVEEDIDDEQQTSTVSADSLSLLITNIDSRDTSWVLVISDNIIKEDYLIYPGSGKNFKAGNNFKFTLGNSGVIRLELNGENLEFEGRRRSVRHFKLDNKGLERLYSPPNLTQE